MSDSRSYSAKLLDQIVDHLESKSASASNRATAAVNTAVVINKAAAGAGISNVIGAVYWSYNAAPTGGKLTIEDGSGTIVFEVDITSAGPGQLNFEPQQKGTANTALIITLAAAGAAVTGKLNITHWTE